jgi:hypothetical protein
MNDVPKVLRENVSFKTASHHGLFNRGERLFAGMFFALMRRIH